MISLLKGLRLCSRNMRSTHPESKVTSCIFEFRGKKLEIHNTSPWDVDPYLGCKLSRQDVEELMRYLLECLKDKKCDACWDISLPSALEISGEIKCKHCGELYR